MKDLKTTAILFKNSPLFETSNRIECFSPDLGKTVALARVHKTKKGTQGHFSPPNLVSLVLSKGRQFFYIKECVLIDSFYAIRQDFNAISLVYYFINIVRRTTSFEQKNSALFNLLCGTIQSLNENISNLDNIKAHFHKQFLAIEGLLDNDHTPISDKVFRDRFEQYAHQPLLKPLLLRN